MTIESRAYTAEEVRNKFLEHIMTMVDYWQDVNVSTDEKLDGLAFSFLNLLDGTTHLPAFDLYPAPHPDDKKHAMESAENYYDPELCINDCELHKLWPSFQAGHAHLDQGRIVLSSRSVLLPMVPPQTRRERAIACALQLTSMGILDGTQTAQIVGKINLSIRRSGVENAGPFNNPTFPNQSQDL